MDLSLLLAFLILFGIMCIFAIGFLVGAKQGTNQLVNQIKKDGGYYDMEYTSSAYPILTPTSSINNDTMGTIGSKPKTQTDYQMEHKAEGETPAIDFMHNWIQEKSGKKPVSQKRKPKSVKENENDFDLGGSE
jgi:hypothetical protein